MPSDPASPFQRAPLLGEIRALIARLHARREAGGITERDVQALHDEARALTRDAVDDPGESAEVLRDLRRMLYTLAFDAGLYTLAERLIDDACPPDLRRPPRAGAPASSAAERLKWRSARARLHEMRGELDATLAEHLRLGDDYLACDPPDPALFAVLTNAIEAAYELGEYAMGASLLNRAEALAQDWPPGDAIGLSLATARLYPPLVAGEVALFLTRHAAVRALVATLQPAALPLVDRFAALSCLQMGAAEHSLAFLGPLPPDDTPVGDLASDTLVRLQAQIAAGEVSAALAARGLALLGCEGARGEAWSLLGALTTALFHLGQTGPALLTGTLFMRRIASLMATLPRNPLKARERRRNILAALEPLKTLLVAVDHMRAAQEVEHLHSLLSYGMAPPGLGYRDWAPSPRIRAAAEAGEALLGVAAAPDTEAGQAFRRHVERFSATRAAPKPARPTPGRLAVSFLPEGDRLIRVRHDGPQGLRSEPLALPLPAIAEAARRLDRAIRRDDETDALCATLGAALFAGMEEELRHARALDLAPFGPVATLPFAALVVAGQPLCAAHELVIRTCAEAPPRRDAPPPGAPLRVLHARGGAEEALSETAQEAQLIAASHGNPPGAVIAEFDRPALEAALADAPRTLHVAAHFRLHEDNLARSSIVGRDGVEIAIGEIFAPGRDLSATQLVFLSGCDSAGHGGGRSLAGHLHTLGSRAVIASLWPVEDRAARALASRTHAGIARGQSPAAALNAAMHALRASAPAAPPRHWAAFQCYEA